MLFVVIQSRYETNNFELLTYLNSGELGGMQLIVTHRSTEIIRQQQNTQLS